MEIQLGDTGSEVYYLQMLLNSHGFGVVQDGDFGPATKTALVNFQKSKSLVADGIVGPATYSALGVSRILFKDTPEFQRVSPTPDNSLKLRGGNAERSVRTAYNTYGGLLEAIAPVLFVDLPSLLSIIAVESGGAGLQAGRPVIRFEVHQFYRRWGKYNKDVFNSVFKFSKDRPWQGHEMFFEGKWQTIHGKQTNEYIALQIASEFSEQIAYSVISMGAGQLMGWHHNKLGYATPKRMFDAMHTERGQVLSFLDYIVSEFEILTALQDLDWYHFAYYYNGPGQPTTYRDWLNTRYTLAKKALEELP